MWRHTRSRAGQRILEASMLDDREAQTMAMSDTENACVTMRQAPARQFVKRHLIGLR